MASTPPAPPGVRRRRRRLRPARLFCAELSVSASCASSAAWNAGRFFKYVDTCSMASHRGMYTSSLSRRHSQHTTAHHADQSSHAFGRKLSTARACRTNSASTAPSPRPNIFLDFTMAIARPITNGHCAMPDRLWCGGPLGCTRQEGTQECASSARRQCEAGGGALPSTSFAAATRSSGKHLFKPSRAEAPNFRAHAQLPRARA